MSSWLYIDCLAERAILSGTCSEAQAPRFDVGAFRPHAHPARAARGGVIFAIAITYPVKFKRG